MRVARRVTVIHRTSKERREFEGYVELATDRLFVVWDLAGQYEVSPYTGALKGAPSWYVGRESLAWFRRSSARWRARVERRRCYPGGVLLGAGKKEPDTK